jgi:Insertion element 4 transposase N-terminal
MRPWARRVWEQRRTLLPARLMVYFVLALRLFRAGTAGAGR